MNEQEIELFARISIHEFLLEIAYANAMSAMPTIERKKFLDDIMNRVRFRATASDGDTDHAMHIQKAMIRATERFFAKVEDRIEPGK